MNLTLSINVQDELGTQFHTMQPMCIHSSGNRMPSLHRLPRKDPWSFLACRCRDSSVSSITWLLRLLTSGSTQQNSVGYGPDMSEAQTKPSKPPLPLLKRESAPAASQVCSVLGLRLRLPRLIGLLALRSQDQESNPSCNVGAEINL